MKEIRIRYREVAMDSKKTRTKTFFLIFLALLVNGLAGRIPISKVELQGPEISVLRLHSKILGEERAMHIVLPGNQVLQYIITIPLLSLQKVK